MKYLKRKYIQHLTPGLTFKADYNIFCVVNNNKVLYTLYREDETIISKSQNLFPWTENWYKLVLVDKELLKKFKL